MLSGDKDLMFIHLDAIRKAIINLPNEEDQEFTWKLNCNLIELRDKVREHGEGK